VSLIRERWHLKQKIRFAAILSISVFAIFICKVQATGIGIKTTPQEMLPFEAEATVRPLPPTLCFQTIAQQNLKLRFKIQMPPETPWLSTDFPVVEGKTLLEMETPMPATGKWGVTPILPIRGDYSVPTGIYEGSHCIRMADLKLHVNENPSKYCYFAGLALVLMLVGFGGGWVIGGQQQLTAGQVLPRNAEILLNVAALTAVISMLALAVGAEMNIHQSCAHGIEKKEADQLVAHDASYRLTVSGDRDTAVGNLNKFEIQALDLRTMKPASGLPIKIGVQQLEENFPVLSFTAIADEAGKVSWKQSFFDGAPHLVEARLEESTSPSLKTWMTVAVEAIHPSLARRLTTFAYMIAFVLVGMLFGLFAKERYSGGAA
jgi:hypothetical protein